MRIQGGNLNHERYERHERITFRVFRVFRGSASGSHFGSSFGFRISVFGFLLLTSVHLCPAQPKVPAPPPTPIERAEGERLARQLVANLLTQKPAQAASNSATIRIRDANGHRSEMPVFFEIVPTPTNYLTIYQVITAQPNTTGPNLTIAHADEKPNEYFLRSKTSGITAPALSEPKKLDA